MKWIVFGMVMVGLGVSWLLEREQGELISPRGETTIELPYLQYAFGKLVEREDQAGKIEIKGERFTYFTEGKLVTGAVHKPEGEGPFPTIVMLRGYVEKEEYRTGYGTDSAAKYFAKRGYLTLAPDFLGYGGSDAEDENSWGARVRRPVEVLDLLASLASIPQADLSRIYLWGHSNGGQISLSILEILGRRAQLELPRPVQIKAATLWAPVSKPFPYSVLYYTDDRDEESQDGGDQGKALRQSLAEFEGDYDVFDYSIDRYWDWIEAPIQVHQGTADEAVPQEWSDELAAGLKKIGKKVKYYAYPGADHNLRPMWETVVKRDTEWFEENR